MIITIIAFILIISFLIFIHEFGHYCAALKFGMKVNEFSIGMGPKLFQKVSKKTGIVYSIRAIPIGGFCQIKGEDGEEDKTEVSIDTEEKKSDSFTDKKIWQRAVVLFAGVFMNFIVAIVFIYIGLVSGFPSVIDSNIENDKGISIQNENIKIYNILKDSNADKNKLKAGIDIISIDNIQFNNIEDLKKYIDQKDEIELKIKDGNKEYTTTLNKEFNKDLNQSIFGISFEKVGIIKYKPLRAIPETFKATWSLTEEMVYGLKYLISNIFSGHGIPDGLSGPIGIAVLTGDVVKRGYSYILQFIALISLNLAFMNILPFPALDGGRILFLLFEKIKGARLNQKFESISNLIGFVLLMILVIAVSFKDVFTFILHK